VPRALVGTVLAAAVLVPAWLSLESAPRPWNRAVGIVLVALAAVLVAALARRRVVVAGGVALASFVALGVAFERPLRDALPAGERGFFGPVLSSFRQGLLDFFDTRVPFDALSFPTMRGTVLLAIFGFVLATGLALVARRPLVAVALVVVGTGWPATMSLSADDSNRPLLLGAAVLAVALAFLVLARASARRLVTAGVVGLALVAAAVAGSTSDAVAKEGFTDWASWDFYDRPDDPVNVNYVWDANYDGIEFPEKRTTVFTVETEGVRRQLYWRATSLDEFTGRVWRESLETAAFFGPEEPVDVAAVDPLLPVEASDRENWVRQDVRIAALADARFVGSGQAVRWEGGGERRRVLATNGTLIQQGRLERGQTYSVWSYVPRARPGELDAAGTSYPEEVVDRYLRVRPARIELGMGDTVDDGLMPVYGAGDREAAVTRFLDSHSSFEAYRGLYRTARDVTAESASPYEAATALEAWFRGTGGGFVYDEQPPSSGSESPLPFFLETRRGYCQHYAGAMALMLRYLGIPARVAAGFTSGSYDAGEQRWTVTDHNAHTWVEVYFPRLGWIPFDPTPNRGELSAEYSPFSAAFDAAEAARLGGGLADIPEVREQVERANALEQREGGALGAPGAGSVAVERGPSILGLALLVLAGAVGLLLVVKEARRRLRYASRDPRALAAACRRDLAGYLADQGVAVPPSATPQELGALAARHFGVHPELFVRSLSEARYGPERDSRRGARQARRELRRLRGAIRRGLGLGERLRGALSLRSLTA
jgi:protein-glutamine gamma-glutamyltransferase